jgi:hypothetical protein
MIDIISKESNQAVAEKRIREGFIPTNNELIHMVEPTGILDISDPKERFSAIDNAVAISDRIRMSKRITEYGGAMHVPRVCHAKSRQAGKKVMMSAYEMLRSGMFDPKKSPQASGNTLPADWQNLWDAMRVDISIRKTALPVIRDIIYNVQNMPNSDQLFKLQEMFPAAFVFERNNGEGQAIPQGELLGGQTEDVEHFIYAVGFTRTLLSELYDKSFDSQRVTDGVAVGYNGLRDDLAIAPILAFNFAGVAGSQTPADTTGSQRQEKLYNTLENAIAQMARRTDPLTGRRIAANNLIALCEPEDAKNVQRIVNGLTSGSVGGQDTPKILPPISDITQIVTYEGETIIGRSKTTAYPGVTRGKMYLIKRNNLMSIGIKRGLTVEVDRTPDVPTLAREKRAWYLAEGQHVSGIGSYIQEVTLPAYTP